MHSIRTNPRVIAWLFSWAAMAAWASAPAIDAQAQRVLDTEDAYVAAEVSRDEAVLRRLVDDRFIWNRGDGTTGGKEDLLGVVMSGSMSAQTLRERTVMVEGDVAFVFGTADLRFPAESGGETVTSLRYTAAYVNRSGQWRLLALQMQARAAD